MEFRRVLFRSADKAVRVQSQADWHHKNPLPQGKSNLLVRPTAGVKVESQKCCKRLHGAQRQLDLVLPFQAWRDVLVSDKRRNPTLLKLEFEVADGGFVSRNMPQKKAKVTLFPDVLHLGIGWFRSWANTRRFRGQWRDADAVQVILGQIAGDR